ncbi:hypothetical protein TGAM01_v202035 [Trichoderma gamsii]|uniref:NACHT domain-containing protein n=1 Tax=Trichoderma gamsii TaxID=398673 RepID=A0A2P4ZXA8_9HYPO|nr:hypothetical protein TGAM01_v202035 [Trichoderma gamsii]PON28927.1 hypothetical protein TGAM01_v202035 [Trichoderma gamsii]
MRRLRERFRSKSKTGVPDTRNTQQSQKLHKGTDTNEPLAGSDKSNEGTERSSTPLITEHTPIRELWALAYEKLRDEDGELFKNYETELKKSVPWSLAQMIPIKANKRDAMEAILRIKMDEINTNASSPEFKAKAGEIIQLFVKVVGSANDYISNAASANPYTSIAWTGVSLILPLLLNPSEQREALAKGLDYIASLIALSRMREELYVDCYESGTGGHESFRQSHNQYKAALEKLYRHILRFQVTVYCYYTNVSALRFAQDSIKWHSWEQLVNELRDQESNFTAIEEKWRDIQRREEHLAVKNRQQTTNNTLSAQLSVSQKAFDSATEKEYEELLHWLCDVDHSAMHNAARDRHETGTNEWLISDSEEFKAWETGDRSLLWLHGKAGSGKSILTSSVIKYLRDQYASNSSLSTALAYFYFSFSDPQKQRVDVMLASLIKQICSYFSGELLFREAFRGHKKRGERPDTQTLEKMLVTSASSFSNVYVVIDALDECPLLNDQREKLLKSLGRIVIDAPKNVHIFLTSRKEQDIDKRLRAFLSPPSRIEIDLLAHQETLNRDIHHYIDLKLATDAFHSWPESVKEEVKQSLVEKADCMFQYVRFQFEGLQKLTATPQIRKALRELPIGLDATYDRILQSIDSDFQCQVLGSLKWLAFSKRTLSIGELSEVFTLYTMNSNDGIFDEAERPFSCTDILKYFSGLIIVNGSSWRVSGDSRTVRLVHFSLKEYLTSSRVLEGPTSVFSFKEVDSHLSIVRVCLIYLGHISSQYAKGVDLKFSGHSYHLANYLCDYWLVHLEEILCESADIGQEALPLLAANSQSLVTILHIGRDLPRRSHPDLLLRPYCYTAFLGLCRLTEFLISECVNKYITSYDLGRALSIAAYQGNTDIMRLLLKAGADVNVCGTQGTSLRTAMRRGDLIALDLLETHGAIISSLPITECIYEYPDEEVVEYLLDKGADINMQNKRNETAVHVGFSRGDERIFKLLLERGADVNAGIHEHLGTPLQRACWITKDYTTRFVKMLLDRGADPNNRGGRFGTALQAACAIISTNGSPEDPYFSRDLRHGRLKGRYSYGTSIISQKIRLLIDHGADVNIQGGEYGTALHALAGSTEPETGQLIELLLNNGAKVNQLSDWGTALHVACHEGMIETVHLLLNRDADVNAVGGKFGTPLQAAVTSIKDWRWGIGDDFAREKELRLEIVELLLERGAEINQKGGKYGIALQAAYANEHVDAELIRLLLDHGADITAEGGHHESVLAAACSNPRIDLESVQMLLDRGADVNAKGGADGTALIVACKRENLELMQVLVGHGADVNAKGPRGQTALITAFYQEANEFTSSVAKLLLEKGADVNAEDEEGQTPLTLSCLHEGRLELVELLLKEGADVNAEQRDGRTPLTIACRYNRGSELVKLLLEHGANVFHQDCAAWHEVAQRWAPTWKDKLAKLELFHNYHIDVNHVHKEHGTVLNTLVKKRYHDSTRGLNPLIRWLLDHGADINILGGDFGFPLQAACTLTGMAHDIIGMGMTYNINSISANTKLLLEQCPDIDVNAQGGRFGSALQAAAFSGQAESVKLLLEKNANVNAAGGKYGSALNAAIVSGHWNIVEILLQAGATPDCYVQQQPDEELLENIRKEEYVAYLDTKGAADRYMKFWEVQSKSRLKN